jgi:predicted nucleic acid-binding protein
MSESTDSAREIVDTNILIYASDPAEGDKRVRALELIGELIDQGRLALSGQVLNEFYTAATRPNKPPSLSHEDASQIIRDLAGSAEILPLTAAVTLRALDAIPRHGFSFWDSLTWAVAKENSIPVIYSEGFQHGRDVEGVRFQNPFVTGPPGPSP